MSDRGFNGQRSGVRWNARGSLGSLGRWGALGIGLALGGVAALGHRVDEILQAALIDIEPGHVRVEMGVTPGVGTWAVWAPLVDRNGDGVFSKDELATYEERLRGDLALRLGDRVLNLESVGVECPSVAELKSGHASVRFGWKAGHAGLEVGEHALVFLNRHLTNHSVFLANAILPESRRVEVGRQTRSSNQSEVRIEFRLLGASESEQPRGEAPPLATEERGGSMGRLSWAPIGAGVAGAVLAWGLARVYGRRRWG